MAQGIQFTPKGALESCPPLSLRVIRESQGDVWKRSGDCGREETILGAFVKVLDSALNLIFILNYWGIWNILFSFKTKYLLKFKNTGTLICKPCYFLLSETLVRTFVSYTEYSLNRELELIPYLKYSMWNKMQVKYTRLFVFQWKHITIYISIEIIINILYKYTLCYIELYYCITASHLAVIIKVIIYAQIALKIFIRECSTMSDYLTYRLKHSLIGFIDYFSLKVSLCFSLYTF